MDDESKRWAAKFCALMEARDVSAATLADKLETAVSTVYHWREGRRFPSRRLQRRLARALGVTQSQLHGFDR